MKQLTIRFDITVSPGTRRFALAAGMLCLVPIDLASESVTLATYYPAPSGVYTNMITTGLTRLARDGGLVAIGDIGAAGTRLTVMNGNVGIGTTSPTAKLEITTALGATSVDLRVTGRMWTESGVWLDATPSQFIGMKTATELGIWNNGWRMSVDNTGKVGIGVAAAAETLDVEGTIIARGCAGVAATFYGGGVVNCAPGTYATWIRGIMSERQTATLTNADGSGSMYCCPCAGVSCATLN